MPYWQIDLAALAAASWELAAAGVDGQAPSVLALVLVLVHGWNRTIHIHSSRQCRFFFLNQCYVNFSCCGYLHVLEVPHLGTSNEYPQLMFTWRNKKNIIWIPEVQNSTPQLAYLSTIWTWASKTCTELTLSCECIFGQQYAQFGHLLPKSWSTIFFYCSWMFTCMFPDWFCADYPKPQNWYVVWPWYRKVVTAVVYIITTLSKDGSAWHTTVIYLQFYTYASQDSLGLYKVSPTKKSWRLLQNFPL